MNHPASNLKLENFMAKISVYLNSNASHSTGNFSQEEFRKFFFRHEVQVRSPKGLDDLNSQIASDLDEGTEYIFAVGGDGTANTISQNLIGKNVKLMVVPAGTANDFAQEIGISSNLKKISQVFNNQTTKKVDAIKVNGRYMISNGGLGLANEVAKTVNRYRHEKPGFKRFMKTFGKQTYSLIYAQHILAKPFVTRSVMIESPDFPLINPRINTAMILINNQEYIGGKFRVAPFTKNDDGKFNVSLFLHKNRIDLMKCTLQMMSGIYPKNDKELITFETDKLILNELDGFPLEFFGDGETFPASSVLDISIEKNALEVCTYKGESFFCSSYSLDQIETIQ
jgi:diacylglycerol kinase (ATP)